MSGGRAEQRVKDTFRHPTAAEVCADVGTKIAIANLRLELERQRQATTSKFPRVCVRPTVIRMRAVRAARLCVESGAKARFVKQQ